MGLCRRAQPAADGKAYYCGEVVVQAMNGKAQIRVSWHRLAAVILGLLVMAAPMVASLCAPGDCLASNSKTEAGCDGMTMPPNASAIMAESRTECCQVGPGVPATVRPSTDTEKAKAGFL